MLFGRSRTKPPASATRIGIPRALTTHLLFPLYSAFFSSLGMEVVLSDVDPRGELKSYSGFCFPAQIAHGAVLDLARRGVDWIFLPHVVRMPQPNACRDSYLCPITQAMLASEMGAKPYLILEIDAHTADAGVQTRLEAFLDIFFMMDENFLLYKKRALELLDQMKKHGKVWSMYVFSSANALRKYGMRQLVELGVCRT